MDWCFKVRQVIGESAHASSLIHIALIPFLSCIFLVRLSGFWQPHHFQWHLNSLIQRLLAQCRFVLCFSWKKALFGIPSFYEV